MCSDHPETARLAALRPALQVRDDLLRAIHDFFHERGFIEVETPVRVVSPALEDHIDAEPAGNHYLRTSPELHMKRLLAAGYERIYQVGPCFREGERGDIHHPEYTMLEWYRTHADYNDILADTKALVIHLAKEVAGTTDIQYKDISLSLAPAWEYITVRDAFVQFAGWDPVERFDADRFDIDLVGKVEPNLPRDVPVILANYPAERAALARLKDGSPAVAERWELYIGGLELANAYSELTDPQLQRERFEACAQTRAAAGRPVYGLDETFLESLGSMPPAGGIALGIDRLVMLFANAASLDDVLPFRE